MTTVYPANPDALAMLVISGLIFGFVFYRAMKQNKLPSLRRMAAVEAIEDGIKRAVELGKSVFVGYPSTGTTDPSTMQTVTIIGDLAKRIAGNSLKGVYASGAPEFIPLMTGVIRDGYTSEGKVEDFNNPQMTKIMALPGDSSGFSAGLYNLIREENIGTALIVGYQYVNAHAIGEILKAANVFSVIGHPNIHVNLPLCITSYDYAILLNEYYALAAYLGKDAAQLGSVRGMDILTYGTILALIFTPIIYLVLHLR